ncbi:hypothetical protein ACIF8T_25190 [Streptomyces sp. NPDC085946]
MTSADHVLDLIRDDPEISSLLEGVFDLDVSRDDHGGGSVCPRVSR